MKKKEMKKEARTNLSKRISKNNNKEKKISSTDPLWIDFMLTLMFIFLLL
jgi:hypothetical protein